jgi:transposase
MTTKNRRQWTAEEKLRILEEARQTPQTISEVCRRQGLAPGQFYAWEKRARQGALEALRARKRGRKSGSREAQLETEVTRLRAVAAELSAENLELKKGLWP